MATSSLDEATAKEVLRQVEFYFSDSNIPRDKFLRNTISASEDGMVSLALICSFKKMRGFLKLGEAKPEDVPGDTVKAVAETLRNSTSVKVAEDGKKVGRVAALLKPEEAVEQLDLRTIAASPLEHDVKQENVESFFGQYAKVNSVRLPRHVADKRVFCGAALIEFSTEEEAEKILKQSLVFEGVELELKPKKEFDEERAQEIEEFENSRRERGSKHDNNSNAEADYPKGLIVAFTLKSMAAGVPTEQNGTQEPVEDNENSSKTDGELNSLEHTVKENEQDGSGNVATEGENNMVNVVEEKVETVDEENVLESKGEQKLSEVPIERDEKMEKPNPASSKDNKNVVSREVLKAVFEKFGIVKFIDFKIGQEAGYVRFEQPEAAQKARAAAVLAEEGGLIVKNFVAILEPVTGEAEKEYWSLFRGNQERYQGNRGGRGRGGKHHRRYGKHPRSREYDSSTARPSKAQRVGAS